ncbi:MAG TPA: class I SAM-dependent methyltransferase [Rhizomicrobium sp.]|jgi:SAM-dependent methyltransferase|nr:class I SAM-dependent methyltransferase [Rhizomicrobium sp.]
MTEPANADQIKFWNGPTGLKWTQFQADMDRNLAAATAGILPFAKAAPGERVLDIGCGAGETSLKLAEAVGPNGRVTGVDVSAPLLGLARARAGAAKNVAFVEADAAFYPFAPDHDLVFSRFGVMFFDAPAAAFANIRTALKPGGRLAFVCWRPAPDNQWVALPAGAARGLLPPQPPPDPLAPGPFAFADPGRVAAILTAAGFRDVRIEKLDGHMDLGRDADHAAFQMTNLGPLSRALGDASVDDAARERVRVAVKAALEDIRTPDGIRPAIACWLVGARV